MKYPILKKHVSVSKAYPEHISLVPVVIVCSPINLGKANIYGQKDRLYIETRVCVLAVIV